MVGITPWVVGLEVDFTLHADELRGHGLHVPNGGSFWPEGVVDGVEASPRPCGVIEIGTGLAGDLGYDVLGLDVLGRLVLSKILPEASGTLHV